MLWILFIMAAMVAVVVAIIVGGLVTPRDYVVTRTLRLHASAEAVWATIRDVDHTDWRDDLDDAHDDGHDDASARSEWSWDITPDGDGILVAMTERGRIGNPLVRFFAAHVTGHTKRIDGYLHALARRHGESAVTIVSATTT